MASFDDLGRALRDDAVANAPDASVIDVDAVTRAARARRRPRQWGAGALGLVAVLGVGGIAAAAVAPPSLIAASESGDTADLESAGADELSAPESEGGAPARVDGLLSCGSVPPAPGQAPIGLELDVRLSSVGDVGQELTGSVRVINADQEPRTLVTSDEAQAVILQGGTVVGDSVAIDQEARTTVIDPGVSLDLPVLVSTRSCVDGGALPAGEYTVLVVVDTRRSVDEPSTLAIAPAVPLRLE